MGGGGAIVDSFRDWCRQRWSKINSPCVASDAIAPETLQRSVSSSSSHPSTNHSHSHNHNHSKDLPSFHHQTPAPPHYLPPPPPPPSLPHRLPSPLSIEPALLSLDTELHKDPTKAPPPPSSKHHDVEKNDGKSHPDLLHCKVPLRTEFFTEYGESNRYALQEVIGKGSYGVVCSAIDRYTGERVAIKKINDIFEHVSDAMRILREIKLLRLLRHPDIVEVKHITLPLSRRGFKDIYVVFELMESDLHQVIKANDDLTPEHHQFFLYQLLRAMKYIHTANVYHRDLKPKNILANADCKLKICDFGLARVAFNDAPTAIFWTDYVATRWYRAPELCGSFFSKYTPAVDIWSVGCIFAEVLSGKPPFPGKNVVHQLDLITDLLGSPSPEAISRTDSDDKARSYLSSMCKKLSMPLNQKFPNADPLALQLLKRLLAFDPRDRPTAEEAMGDPYFKNLANKDREPSAQPITKAEFDFERRKMSKEDVRELIYREILEYHPKVLKEYMSGKERGSLVYPSGVDNFKRQFSYLEDHYSKNLTMEPRARKLVSPPRDSALDLAEPGKNGKAIERYKIERASTFFTKASSKASHKASQGDARLTEAKEGSFPKKLLKSASVSGSLSSTSSAFGNIKRSAASKHESGSKKKESLDLGESKHRFLGFEFTRKVQALSSSLAYR